jgi:hypothetical protein
MQLARTSPACREVKEHLPGGEPPNMRRTVRRSISEPACPRSAKAGALSARELVIAAITDKHRLGTFHTEALYRFDVDQPVRLGSADLE